MTTSSHPAPHAIILFAHGSRDPLWRQPIEAVATLIRQQQPQTAVSCAYLELCEPSLPQAAADLIALLAADNATNSIAKGVDFLPANGRNSPQNLVSDAPKSVHIRIVPMFLGMGKHAREDLPELAAQLRQAYPQVHFELAPTVGEDPRLTAMLAQLALSA